MLNQNENGFFIIQPTLDQMLEFSFYFLDQQTNSRKTRKPRKAKEKVVTYRQSTAIAAQGVAGGRSNEPAQSRRIGQAPMHGQLYSHIFCL